MKRSILLLSSLCLAAPLLAQAVPAYVVADISLQAGPDTEYPSITELPAGTEVALQGCLDDWSWCDVISGNDRGWVAGSFLEEEYENRRVYVVDYGPRIGIPVVSFSLGVYWEHNYRNRPWFAERERWESRHIHPHAIPRPAVAVIRDAHARDAHAPQATQSAPAATPTAPATAPRVEPAHHAAAQAQTATPAADATRDTDHRAPAAQGAPAPKAPEHPVAPPHQKSTPPEAGRDAGPQPPAHPAPPPKQPPGAKGEQKAPKAKDEHEHKDGDKKDHD